MGYTRRAALGGMTASALAGRAMGAWAAEPARPRTFDIRLKGVQPSVTVYVNRLGPLRFVLDSGAGFFAIADAVAPAVKLKKTGSTLLYGAVGMTSASIYKAEDLIIGENILMKDAPIYGAPLPPKGEIDGLLPPVFFRHALIDFANRKLTVYPEPAKKPPEGMTVFPADRANVEGDHRPYVKTTFEGRPVRLLVDTGFTGGLILQPGFVKKAGLAERYKAAPKASYAGVTGRGQAAMTLGEVTLGGYRFDNMITMLSDPASFSQIQVDGAIGMEILRRFDFWTDVKSHRWALKPNANFNDVVRYDRSGLITDYANNTDELPTLVAVRPGGAGDKAGFKRGDKILGFTGGGDLWELDWALSGAPGSKVSIKVRRGTEEHTLTVVLEETLLGRATPA